MELSENNKTQTESIRGSFFDFNKDELTNLSSFFDILAKFDCEDKKKEKLAFKTDPLVSAPKGSILASNK